ncbi:hypothetical protein QJ850_gp172 [Acanthamoeba polyphaga mimivirus]|uniref:Uncharacterized protein n=1 Tax=Acanthamoeba polyphaga mimivirus Kroon TaxID=3069720 RepID=A0A0G2Y9M0_9VIRU|nr:hypothetical protein QJ850_gp172 [Acanthamoeba polyphaga mimivirus]AKI80527.1 hypothetical protein [Acanthamoeba polyphaga mimivirus Kroon]
MFGHPSDQDIDEIESWFDWPISVYDFPRFRDVYVNSFNPIIKVTTRTGGGNREEYEEHNDYVSSLEGYISDKDAWWDETYANFKYEIPERSLDKWREYIERKKLELQKSQQIDTNTENIENTKNTENTNNNSVNIIIDEFLKAATENHQNINTNKNSQNTNEHLSCTNEITSEMTSKITNEIEFEKQSQEQLSNECITKLTELLDKTKLSINDLNKTMEKLNETINKYHK